MAPEANPGGFLIDKLRELIPNLNYPESTFQIETEDCPEGSIKIMIFTQQQYVALPWRCLFFSLDTRNGCVARQCARSLVLR